MQPRPEPAISLYRRRERDGLPAADRRLKRLIEAGEVIRVAPGSFVPAAQWEVLSAIDRHLVRVVEAVDRARGPVLIGLAAAAAVWGIDRIGAWPRTIDTIVPRRGGGRSTGVFRRWTTTRGDIPTVAWRGHELTTPAQTALDLARVGTFTDGVVAFDQARWGKRRGGPLTSESELAACLDAPELGRGGTRARRAGEFSVPLSDSVRETQSRILIDRLGFPAPVLQQPFLLRGGRHAYPDFWFPEHGHAAEFDGTGKYLDPELLRGRTPAQVLLEEKDRADELRRLVRRVSRWRTPALRDPRLLWDILHGDGLPSTRPRPPAGLHFA